MEPTVLGTVIEGWRLTFLINVPIGIAGAVAAPLLLGESDSHSGQLDVPGAITATAGLLSLVYGITRAGDRSHGWGDTWTLVALAVGVVLLVAFVLVERVVRDPLLPGRVLASRDRLAAYAVMMLIPAAMFTQFFFLTLILQNIMGASPMDTGLMFLPFSITMIAAAMVTSRLVQRFDPGRLAGLGATVAAAAVFGLSRIPYDDRAGRLSVDISYWTDIFPFVVLMPVGLSLVFIPMTMSVVHAVSPADSGIASGVLNTMQQVGGALGLATLSTIALNAATAKVTDLCRGAACDPGDPLVQAVSFTHGASIGFVACAVMLLAGGVVALLFNRIEHEDLGGREAPVEISAH
jgi:predicted MFS family arabinose efflux permease